MPLVFLVPWPSRLIHQQDTEEGKSSVIALTSMRTKQANTLRLREWGREEGGAAEVGGGRVAACPPAESGLCGVTAVAVCENACRSAHPMSGANRCKSRGGKTKKRGRWGVCFIYLFIYSFTPTLLQIDCHSPAEARPPKSRHILAR